MILSVGQMYNAITVLLFNRNITIYKINIQIFFATIQPPKEISPDLRVAAWREEGFQPLLVVACFCSVPFFQFRVMMGV
jgi:hypothetical protein